MTTDRILGTELLISQISLICLLISLTVVESDLKFTALSIATQIDLKDIYRKTSSAGGSQHDLRDCDDHSYGRWSVPWCKGKAAQQPTVYYPFELSDYRWHIRCVQQLSDDTEPSKTSVNS